MTSKLLTTDFQCKICNKKYYREKTYNKHILYCSKRDTCTPFLDHIKEKNDIEFENFEAEANTSLIDTSLIALTNLVLNLVFIPTYGIKFAAFSTSLSFILLFILRTIYLYKNYSKSIKEIKYLYSFLIILISLITIIFY